MAIKRKLKSGKAVDNQVESNIDRRKVIKKKARKIQLATSRHAHNFIIKRWANAVEVRRNVLIWVAIIVVLIGSTGLQLIWCQQSYRTETAANNTTYAEGALGPVDTLNPLYASSSAENSLSKLLFSSILYYDTSGNLNYDLAKSIEVDGTGSIYTVKIRSDAKWSDGESVTTKDIVFTVGLMQDTSVRSVISGWDGIKATAIDNTTVQFKLSSPYAAFEHALTFSILPEHILKGVSGTQMRENTFSQNPVGSGLFKLKFIQNVDASTGEKIVYLTRNDSYYRDKTKIADFDLHVYPDTTSILDGVSKGEVNAAVDLTPSDTEQVDGSKYNIMSVPIQSAVYAILNTQSQFLGDSSVRKALQLATNTNAIRAKLGDNARYLDLPFTSNQLTGDAPSAPKYNLDEAKKLLEDAGWKLNKNDIREKNGQTLKLTVVTTKSSEYEDDLETLAGQWRLLGVIVNTKIIDTSDATQDMTKDIIQPRNYDVLLYKLDIGADADMFAYWHSSQISSDGLNLSNYSNAISDELLTSARLTTDESLRNSKYIEFAKQWLNDVPAIGLYQSTIRYVSGKNVTTFSSSDDLITAADRYNDIQNWSSSLFDVYKTP